MNGRSTELERILAESRQFFASVERTTREHTRAGMRRPEALELAVDEELSALIRAAEAGKG
ncbi:MAG: hypothetical protein ABSG38_16505 [Spirochaetia bacterium]|jgi:hypothetical protein